MIEDRESHTSHITDARTAKNSDQFRRRASIVADGNDVAERTILALPQRIEDIDKAVGSTTTRENHDASIKGHGEGSESRVNNKTVDQDF